MERHPNEHASGGASNSAAPGGASAADAWNTMQYNPSDASASGYMGQPDVQQQQPSQQHPPDGGSYNTFQNYPQYAATEQQLTNQHQAGGYAAAGTEQAAPAAEYWSAGYPGGYQQEQTYPNHYDDPNTGLWTGTGGDLYAPGSGTDPYAPDAMAMGSPPDLFNAAPSMDNSAGSSDLHSAAASAASTTDQPDMLPSTHSDTQPPDMLPPGGQVLLPAVGHADGELEDRMLGAEIDGGASGPDILSNGMRGDERTRPDILSPATEDCSVEAASNSRSSSTVLHSPTGAFEPVRSSTSRTGSMSESEHSVHLPYHTGASATPLWEQPSLPPVQLQPAASDSTSAVPVQILPTQILQSMGAESLPPPTSSTYASLGDTTVAGVTSQLSNLTLTDVTSSQDSGQASVGYTSAYPVTLHQASISSSVPQAAHVSQAPPSSIPHSFQAPPSSIPHSTQAPTTSLPHSSQGPPTSHPPSHPSTAASSFTPIHSVPEVVPLAQAHAAANEQQAHTHSLVNEQQTHAHLLAANDQQAHTHSSANDQQVHAHSLANDQQAHAHSSANKQQTTQQTSQATSQQSQFSNQQTAYQHATPVTSHYTATTTQVPNVLPDPSYRQPVPSTAPQSQSIAAHVTTNAPLHTGQGQMNGTSGLIHNNMSANQPIASSVTTTQPMTGGLPINQQMTSGMTPYQQPMAGGMLPNQPMTSNQSINPSVGLNTPISPGQSLSQPISTAVTSSQPMSVSATAVSSQMPTNLSSSQPMNPGMMPNQFMNPSQPMMHPGSQQMNYGMGYGMNYGGMMNSAMMGYQQTNMYPGMIVPNQYQPAINSYGNQQQQQPMYNQMDPQMQQRMAMMKGFKPLTQQQLSANQTAAYHQPRPGFSNPSAAPMRVMGPMVGQHPQQHPQQGYGSQHPSMPGYQQYGSEARIPRNQSFGGYRHDDSYSSYRDDDYGGGYGRPRSRDVYEERRGYGYGSRPSSRSGSRPSSRTGSAAPGMFQTEVNPYLVNQSGFSPRPPSRTSSRLDSVYQQSHTADESSSSSDSEPTEPPRMTPAKFPMPHLIPRLLSNGDTLEVQPNSPDDGQPATICVLRRHMYQPSLVKFPGPLVKGQTHKRDVLDYCQKMAQAAKEDSRLLDRDSTELLWKFLHMLVKQNGTYVGSDIAELLLDGYDVDSTLYTVQSQPRANANMTQQQTIDRFRQLVMFGNTKEALEWAMTSDQWGHALFLSSKMGSRIHAQVLTRFANSSMTHNDPLQTLYQLMSNRQPNSATHPEDGWGTWRPHLAMMLCNPSSDTQLNIKSITSLGDSLAAKGLLHASQFCYLMADISLEPFTKKSAKLSMIGIQSGVSIEEYTHETAIELTEIYEYARCLAGDTSVIPHLQICKFYHARRQVDRGQPTEALAYLEAIATTVSSHVELFSWAFISQLYNMCERLKYYDAEATYVREGRSLELEWITKLGTSLQAKLAISALGEVVGSPLYAGADTIDHPAAQESSHGTAQAVTGVTEVADTTGNYQQVSDTAVNYQQVSDSTGNYQQVTDSTGNCQQVTDTAGNYQQVTDIAGNYQQVTDKYRHESNSSAPSYEPPQAGYSYQTGQALQDAWQGSAPPVTQNSDYTNQGTYNQPEGASQYGNVNYNQGYTDGTSDKQTEEVEPSNLQPSASEPTDYYDYKSPTLAQPSTSTAASKTETSKPQESSAAATKARSSPAKSGFSFGIGSLFSKILPKGKNEVILPDDSKQTIVWDGKLNKWVDTESDGTEESKAAPPPTDSTLGRASPAVQPAVAGPAAPSAPSPAAGGNLYSLKRGRGSKYIDVMGKTAGTSLSPIPQHLFDVTPRSTPTSSIFTPTPTSTDENGDCDPLHELPEQQTSQSQHPPQQQQLQCPPQQQWNHELSDSQMPRNTSMASLEVQNIMSGPPNSSRQVPPTHAATANHQALPTSHQAPPTGHQALPTGPQAPPTGHQAPPTGHQAPPTSHQAPPMGHQAPPMGHQAPPTSHQAPPTGHQAPPTGHQAPPTDHQAPPTTQQNNQEETPASVPSKPPMMFNPSQFKMPAAVPGGRSGALSSRSRYPK